MLSISQQSSFMAVSTDAGDTFIFILLVLLPEVRTTKEISSDETFGNRVFLLPTF